MASRGRTVGQPGGDGGAGHAEDDRGLFVLGDDPAARRIARRGARDAVLAHAGQDDGDGRGAECRGRPTRTGRCPRGGSRRPAGSATDVTRRALADAKVAVVGGEVDRPRGQRLAFPATLTRQGADRFEPRRQPLGEAGRDVLDDQDRQRGSRLGSPESRHWSAAGPPVEVAIATTRPRLRLATERRGRGAQQRRRRRQWRTTLTCDIALTVATRLPRRRRETGRGRARGFTSTSSAPKRSEVQRGPDLAGAVLPVTITIGVGAVIMISLVAARPSIRGMWMSIVTRSGRSSLRQLDRLDAVDRLADDLDLRVGGEDLHQQGAGGRGVFGDEDADHATLPLRQSNCATVSSSSFWSKRP